MKTLLIDIGSTSIKWSEQDNSGITKTLKANFPASVTKTDSMFEVDQKEIFAIVKNIIDSSNAKRVLFSVQMHGYLLADRDNRFITNYISWRDRRCVNSKDILSKVNIKKQTGSGLKVNLPLVSILYIHKTQPELIKIAKIFFTLGSYIGYMLTGENSSHITDIAPTGMYNIIDKKYENNLFDFVMPACTNEVISIGNYKGKRIFSAVGDQQASILGANPNDSYILNIGTASQVCTVSNTYTEGEYETRPYFDYKFLPTVTGLTGGKEIKLHKDSLTYAKELAREYKVSIKKLPPKEHIIATGGVVENRKSLIELVLKEIGTPYRLNIESTALCGLSKLANTLNKE